MRDDEALEAAIRRASPFVAPLALGDESGTVTSWPPDIPDRTLRFAHPDQEPARTILQQLSVPHCAFPIPEVARSATLLANIIDESDSDSIFRRARLFQVFDRRAVPSLAVAAYLAGRATFSGGTSDLSTVMEQAHIEDGWVVLGQHRFPVDAQQRAIMRFRGPSETHETFGAAAVIQSELRLREGRLPIITNPEVFKDCYVLFGFSAPGLKDLRPTPLSPTGPGVEIHATVLDNLLSNDFLRDAPRWLVILSVLLLAEASAIMVVSSKKVRHSILAFAVFLTIPVVVAMGCYHLGFWWPIVVVEGATALALVSALGLNYATEGRLKAFYKQAFQHYLSPAVIERLLDDPSRLQLGGERRELSIFFSDLQGFSSISERLDPHDLTNLLNEYLTDMTDIILEEDGTLDKYEGDAIIAFWNAPLDQPDHALRACRTAVRCQEKLEQRRQEFERRAGAPFRMRIRRQYRHGHRRQYGIEAALRLYSFGGCRQPGIPSGGGQQGFRHFYYGGRIHLAADKGAIPGREMGLLRVVGRNTPVRVFQPLTPDTPMAEEHLQAFNQALASCQHGRWIEALDVFSVLDKDPLSAVYAKRCRELLDKPEASWDGIWNLTEK